MITIVHGGQTGVDRGAHQAAIDNGWLIAGYMPRDARDELGPIPVDVAQFLRAHEKADYAARTEANVRSCDALLAIVQDIRNLTATPGTTKTIRLAGQLGKPRMFVDPTADVNKVARWIWCDLLPAVPLPLALERPDTVRLMIAGPRESKWNGAFAHSAALLRRVGVALETMVARSAS